MNAAAAPVRAGGRPLALALLLPLPLLLLAAWRYDLAANIRVDYRWMVLAVALGVAALAAVATRATRRGWPHAPLLPALAAAIPLAGVVVYAGAMQVGAALLLALAALACASCLRGLRGEAIAVALMAGLALLAALVGWLLPFPLHHRPAYLATAALLVLLRRRALRGWLGAAASGLRAIAGAHPGWCILLAGATAIASLGLWLPSLNYDDNAVHLVLQSQLLADGYYRLDVQTQSWAVAPWANNVLHAIAALLAGQESRAAVAGLWLLLGIAGAWRLARALGAPVATALAASAVFAAQPLTGYFTTTMQVDGASAAIFLHLAAMAATPAAARPGPLAIGLIGGLLLALKTSNLVYLLPLLAWLCLSQPRGARARWLGVLVAGLLPVAASSYAYAWLVTGNPLFPFYNAVFKSPYYPPENFRDLKWMAGIGWRSPWDLAFRTGAYGQFYPGAAGLAVLATLPALLLDAVRRPAPRWIALWAIGSGCVLFAFMQYLRYIYPALAVLAVLGTVALARHLDRRVFAAAALALVLADALLMPTTSWIARDNHWARLLRDGPAARAGIVREVMPGRALLSRALARDPAACVLIADPKAPFVGAGGGHAVSLHRRYDPASWRARAEAQADPTGGRWRTLLTEIGASHVVVDPAREPLLARTLAADGYAVQDREGPLLLLAAASPAAAGCRAFRERRDQARRLLHMQGAQ